MTLNQSDYDKNGETIPASEPWWLQIFNQELLGKANSNIILYQSLIPLNPRTKKNNQRIIKNPKTKAPMIVQNDRYKQYERDSGWFLKKLPEPISDPVNVKCIFYRKDETRCDLTNLLEAIDDILVHYKILKDDNFKIIVGHDGSRVYVDREHPRTEIEITSMSE